MAARRRLAVLGVLVALQGMLSVGFAASFHGGGTAGTAAVADGAVASGDRVALHVRVTAVAPTTVRTALGDELRLEPAPEGLAVGDAVELVGVYRRDGRVEPTAVTTHTEGGVAFAYLASAVAGLLVLVLAARHWRFDRDHWLFRPASTGDGGDRS